MEMTIAWKLDRLDEGEPERRPVECLLDVRGTILVDGVRAGWVTGFHVHARDLASGSAFWYLWDMEARTCAVFAELQAEDGDGLREPLPALLVAAPGIFCVEELILAPEFRGRGLGREVMKQAVADCADARVGAVLLAIDPPQYDWDDDGEFVDDPVLAGLPTDDRARDEAKLQAHFRSWGMDSLRGSRFMVAAPEAINEEQSQTWPPCPIQDYSNTCVLCSGLINLKREEWKDTEEGLAHQRCLGG